MMSSKSLACILALASVGVVGNSLQAKAGESAATISFSGYVAPACMVSIDSSTPTGSNLNGGYSLLCNTGDEYQLAQANYDGNDGFLTVIP
jgi:hypothetical protein